MRVSPVAWAYTSAHEVLHEAEQTALITHNHPDGIKSAQAVALSIYLARTGVDKPEIKSEIETRFGYDPSRLEKVTENSIKLLRRVENDSST